MTRPIYFESIRQGEMKTGLVSNEVIRNSSSSLSEREYEQAALSPTPLHNIQITPQLQRTSTIKTIKMKNIIENYQPGLLQQQIDLCSIYLRRSSSDDPLRSNLPSLQPSRTEPKQQSLKKQQQKISEEEIVASDIPKADQISAQKQQDNFPYRNFLRTFRGPILNYIREQLHDDEYFDSQKIIKWINSKNKSGSDSSGLKKNGICRQDYLDIFRVQKFRPILEEYFASRRIYRDLMISRVGMDKKKAYFKRIHLFARAFRSGEFNHIQLPRPTRQS